MAMHPFQRTELLVGGAGFETLKSARVAVIGLGGVGSYCAEALARSGIGHLTLVDFDRVCITNLNRQLHATRKTVNQPKAELMGERVLAINPKAEVRVLTKFFGSDTADAMLAPPDAAPMDVVFDCIDNMTAKVQLLEYCVRNGIPVVSALGAGGRMDPTRVRVTDLSLTFNDPFARLVRDLLRQRGIETGVTCVWSDEPPNELDAKAEAAFRCICPDKDEESRHGCETRHQVQGSNSWMPPIYGMTMAGVGVNALLGRPVRTVDRAPAVRDQPALQKPSRHRKQQLMAAAGIGRAPNEAK